MSLFHFVQSATRWISGHGLKVQLSMDESFRAEVKLIVSLAFVPPELIEEAFSSLVDTLSENGRFVANYIDEVYIRGKRRNDAKYKKEHWSVFRRVWNEDPKTSNVAEGYHNRLSSLMGRKKKTSTKIL